MGGEGGFLLSTSGRGVWGKGDLLPSTSGRGAGGDGDLLPAPRSSLPAACYGAPALAMMESKLLARKEPLR
jgi:hypothetical protein